MNHRRLIQWGPFVHRTPEFTETGSQRRVRSETALRYLTLAQRILVGLGLAGLVALAPLGGRGPWLELVLVVWLIAARITLERNEAESYLEAYPGPTQRVEPHQHIGR